MSTIPFAPALAASDLPAGNPLATPSSLAFEAPPFDRIKDADYQPAIEGGMRQELSEYEAIANDPAPPTFDNTIVAMEKAGQLLTRANTLFQNLISANSNDVLQKANREEAPRLQAHSDQILLNPKLFARVRALYETRDALGLNPQQKFLLERYHTRFVRAGAELNDADKAKLKVINEQIAKLQTEFRDRLQAASAAAAVIVTDKTKLAGLSDAEIATAAEDAKHRKLDGKYLIAIRNTTQQPVLASLKDRDLRAQILAASEARGDKPGPTDERDIIATLAKLRAEKGKLLGYDSYAAYVIADQMAKTPQAAEKLLTDLVPAATGKAKEEAAELQAEIDRQKGGFALTAYDWPFYAEQVRKATYDVDEAEVKQYFELDRVLKDGVFFAANKLYGLTFKPRTDIPVYQPDVRVWEVFDADGKSLALFYTDYFARPNKDGGAWCNYLNQPSGLLNRKPVIINVANFTKPAPGDPALISFDDVTTMFHEFGHALHAMFSVQQYPTENGFNLPTDVIEFPSQFNEHWALDPTVLASYAKHYKTGAPMPQELVDKIKRAKNYGQGYATTEVLSAALLDLDWHSLPAGAEKQVPDTFEAASLKKNQVDLPQVPPRYRSPYFLHIWANGYEANYYSYLWGEILDDDAFEWFTENGGLTRANGQRFRDMMLGPGFTQDPMALYRAFRGRDPSVEAVKRARGLG
ncbi:MAG TPA: M3 family metallopeptidase [Alphaproteobacteria bacterium]|nr:M3 family metallopeptidase [Alphaproteobacteria bacterium]